MNEEERQSITPDQAQDPRATSIPEAQANTEKAETHNISEVPIIAVPEQYPEEIKGWNWGAFFMSWIWAIGHQTWIGLLSLIPYIGFIMNIILGLKGNEWAWQNRKFENIDQFKKVQKAWAKWGIAYFIVTILAPFAIVIIIFFYALANPHK